MSGNLKFSILLEAIDKVTAPIKRVQEAASRLAGRGGLGRISQASHVLGERMGRLVALTRSLKAGFLAIAGASVAGYTAQRLVSAVVDRGDEIEKTAKRFGMTADQYQRLSYAAKIARVDQDAFNASLGMLTNNAVAAATGNQEMAIWFYRAGINIHDTTGKLKPANVLLGELAERFKSMPDGAKKLSLARALLGRMSGDQLIAMLNGGAEGLRKAGDEAQRLGVIMDDKTIKSSTALGDSIGRLQSSLYGLLIRVLGPLLPVIQQMTDRVTKWVVANRELVATKIRQFLQDLIKGIPTFIEQLKITFAIIGAVARAINTIARAMTGWGMVINILVGLVAGRLIIALVSATLAFIQLGVAMFANPIGLVILGIGALIAIGVALYKNWDTIKQKVGELWDTLVKVFKTGAALVSDIIGVLVRVTLSPFIELLRIIDRVMPKSWQKTAGGQAIRGALEWADKPVATLGAAGGLGGNGVVGGKIAIHIDADGNAKVTQLQSDNPNVDIEAYQGSPNAVAVGR